MLEILRFIFSSFWVWAGTVWLVYISGAAVYRVVAAFRPISIITKKRKDD